MIESGDDEMLEHYLNFVFEDPSNEEFKASKKLDRVDIESEQAAYLDPISQSYNRRLFLSCGLIVFNQLSGGAALGYFGA
jgi:hypothetical protein